MSHPHIPRAQHGHYQRPQRPAHYHQHRPYQRNHHYYPPRDHFVRKRIPPAPPSHANNTPARAPAGAPLKLSSATQILLRTANAGEVQHALETLLFERPDLEARVANTLESARRFLRCQTGATGAPSQDSTSEGGASPYYQIEDQREERRIGFEPRVRLGAIEAGPEPEPDKRENIQGQDSLSRRDRRENWLTENPHKRTARQHRRAVANSEEEDIVSAEEGSIAQAINNASVVRAMEVRPEQDTVPKVKPIIVISSDEEEDPDDDYSETEAMQITAGSGKVTIDQAEATRVRTNTLDHASVEPSEHQDRSRPNTERDKARTLQINEMAFEMARARQPAVQTTYRRGVDWKGKQRATAPSDKRNGPSARPGTQTWSDGQQRYPPVNRAVTPSDRSDHMSAAPAVSSSPPDLLALTEIQSTPASSPPSRGHASDCLPSTPNLFVTPFPPSSISTTPVASIRRNEGPHGREVILSANANSRSNAPLPNQYPSPLATRKQPNRNVKIKRSIETVYPTITTKRLAPVKKKRKQQAPAPESIWSPPQSSPVASEQQAYGVRVAPEKHCRHTPMNSTGRRRFASLVQESDVDDNDETALLPERKIRVEREQGGQKENKEPRDRPTMAASSPCSPVLPSWEAINARYDR